MDDLNEKAFIFGSIFTLSNKLQILGDKFDEYLTIKQWLLLAGISNSGSDSPTISEVATIIGSSRQNAKKMVSILEKRQFLTVRKDKDDARILRISLTEKCIGYFEERENRELKFIEQLYDGFDSTLIKSLCKGISKLEKNIGEMERYYDKREKE
ncbi:DNA-binding MarR family transcriptional regulator [Sedimentibacter acidaminivorans]|uniref:DNA-binding MarR family transcriptional regulator n=1 Tax=Sedimentibacter acidaminivorans TaxID=913099 RepID=A0ABS4GH00_9FIRM|nr:MarR family transcriptional regulator [Sedimentibacter acidaminivorans]MBP1926959.1 DNA-binding MarR family transcriptional regulator [Sedimentibacter acidaminivorans]